MKSIIIIVLLTLITVSVLVMEKRNAHLAGELSVSESMGNVAADVIVSAIPKDRTLRRINRWTSFSYNLILFVLLPLIAYAFGKTYYADYKEKKKEDALFKSYMNAKPGMPQK